MARIPSFEEALLEINQSLGLERPPSKYIYQFADLGLPLEKHREMGGEMLDSILSALDLDEQARRDIACKINEWADFHKALELKTWTGNASQQQVLWHLLAYSYVPGLARRIAFWSLAGDEAGRPFDAGMPGGKFWFLPFVNRENNQIDLPVRQAVEWLLDLLGQQPLEQAFQGLEREEQGKLVNANALRKLQGWRLEGRLPNSAKEINELFHDDAKLDFRGTFPDKAVTDKPPFEDALAFIQRKGLDANTLCEQIPMTAERLEPVLNGAASAEEQQEFLRLISIRYAQPTMRLLRQRFTVARMVQDGYLRLVQALFGKEVKATCADPAKNKLLQLIGLSQYVYNLTIAAWQNGISFDEQDAWFEAQMPWWGKADLMLSIVPSLNKGQGTAYLKLAERLTRKFAALSPESPLEDMFPLGVDEMESIDETRRRFLKNDLEEDLRLQKLIERVRVASPWRALQAEESYWVVSQFVQTEGWPAKVRDMALKRLRELAATPGQTVGAILIELGFLLNGEPKERPRDVQQRVQSLLDEAEASPGYEEWKAPLLRFRAKHRLMQNDFAGASEGFKAALKACSERGFGELRGEIARDAFAVEVAENGLEPKKQEKYYRNMIDYGMFPDGMGSFEDTAVWCEEFFWTDLYRPYPSLQRKENPATQDYQALLGETFGLIKTADWDGLRGWMQRHAKVFRKSNLKESRRNSVLLSWLKLLHTAEDNLPRVRFNADWRIARGAGVVEQHLKHWWQAIALLVEAWPEQAKIADFKGQTPLMLVADRGNAKLTQFLAPLSDVDAQDFAGRTALHAAVSGRSPECVALVLDRNPDVAKVTEGEGNSPLHTAVRFGVPESVRLILDEFPGLASKANAKGQTPLQMADDILENLPAWVAAMKAENRRTGTKEDFKTIIAVLNS